MRDRLAAEVEQFKRANRRYVWCANVAIALITSFAALGFLVLALRGQVMSETTLIRTAVGWTPVLFYFAALWTARDLFASLSREGLVFHGAIAKALTRMGLALSLGGGTSVVAGIGLLFSGPVRAGCFPAFNAPGLTIGVLGLALLAIGQLVRRAEDIRRRNAVLSAELQEFF